MLRCVDTVLRLMDIRVIYFLPFKVLSNKRSRCVICRLFLLAFFQSGALEQYERAHVYAVYSDFFSGEYT